MEQKLVVTFESIKNDRKYSLNIPMGAPVQEVYDFTQEIVAYLVDVSKKNSEAEQEKSPITPELVEPAQGV